jgi:hypothetical protein
MALEKIETLTSIKTSDGLVVTNKVITSSNGDLETYHFSYIIDNERKIFIPDEVRSNLKKMKIENVVIGFLANPFVLDKIVPLTMR